MPSKPPILQADNAHIFDYIRNNSSLAYQERVPEATKGNIAQVVSSLQDYKPVMNEFVDALVNQIGKIVIRNKIWSNPLGMFKRGMLRYGDTIEEVAMGLVRAHRYDPNKCYEDVWKCNKANVMSNFHKIDRQDMYEITISDAMLRRAFRSDDGIQRFLNDQMTIPYNSDYEDEFLIMKNLFVEYAKNDNFYKVRVPDVAQMKTRSEKSDAMAEIVEKIKVAAGMMGFLKTDYNAEHVPTFTPSSNLVLFATPQFLAPLDTSFLAFTFNIDKATLPTRIVTIDDFGINGCQAILADKDIFMCADTLIDFESIRNPKQISWNYFLHHHGIYSMSRFVNAVMFTSKEETTADTFKMTTESVEVTAEGGKLQVPVGGKLQMHAKVTGSNAPQSVMWSLAPKSEDGKETRLKTGTYIDAEGVIHVSKSEKVKQVIVKAISTYADTDNVPSKHTPIVGSAVVTIG